MKETKSQVLEKIISSSSLLKSESKKSLFNINLWFVHYLFFFSYGLFLFGRKCQDSWEQFHENEMHIAQNASTTTYLLVFLLDSSTRADFQYYFMILPSSRKKIIPICDFNLVTFFGGGIVSCKLEGHLQFALQTKIKFLRQHRGFFFLSEQTFHQYVTFSCFPKEK